MSCLDHPVTQVFTVTPNTKYVVIAQFVCMEAFVKNLQISSLTLSTTAYVLKMKEVGTFM